MMKLSLHFGSCLLVTIFVLSALESTNAQDHESVSKLVNPMSLSYLNDHLRKGSPKLILTSEIRDDLRKKIKSAPEVGNYYAAIKLNAEEIMTQPLLEREKIGRRLLHVSREMLYRMGILGMVYSIDGDERVLDRINRELLAVCAFSDWNPSHYLDVAEMSLALALAIDWVGRDLPASTVNRTKENLINKGINPSYNPDGNVGWINGSNNWNQVCHGGMIAAAIVTADVDAELSARTISRALDGIPHAMVEYGPDGVYPEGSTYWGYGTSFSVLTSSMLSTAFGTDFGLAEYPAFIESAVFRSMCNAPSGWYYNFADCGDRRNENGDIVLAWFATYTGNSEFYEKERFMMDPKAMGELSRISGPGLVWLSQFEADEQNPTPLSWKGDGANPIVIFRGGNEDTRQYYFGGKGGRGTVNHGNMDGGSFIFELDGVRWSVDPGNQSYHALEKTGFDLWDRCQECERWTLLTKNNYGHSTLTVNGKLHVVDGFASIDQYTPGVYPQAVVDLTAAFGEDMKKVLRTFKKDTDHSLVIMDDLELSGSTKMITWQMMTTADVEIHEGAAVLRQDGHILNIENKSHPHISPSVISLDPPPLELDRNIENLKRIEFTYPAYLFDGKMGKIEIRLAGVTR